MNIVLDDVRSIEQALYPLCESYIVERERENPTDWVLCRTAEEALQYIRSGEVVKISLDHDLGISKYDGHDVLKELCRLVVEGEIPRPERIDVHSANIVAVPRMRSLIQTMDKVLNG